MPRPFDFRAPSPSAEGEAGRVQLALLRQLESSLERSLEGLLARDLAGFEQSTGEQMALLEKLEPLPGLAGQTLESPDQNAALRYEPALAAELCAVELRVLHLGRVQRSLLGRAQRFLHVISQLLAGPGASYPNPAPAVAPAAEKESDACRA